MKLREKIHYSWYVVFALCMVIAMTTGVFSNSYGQFIKPVCAGLGITRQQMSVNQTIMAVTSFCFALGWGKISKTVNVNRGMCISALIMPIAVFCYSFAPNLYVYYGITVVFSLSNCFISLMVFSYILGNWFEKNRGTAIGLASMGSGIGGMVMNSFLNYLIITFDWRIMYQILGAMMFVIIVPAIWFVVREKPSDKGKLPYGHDEPAVGDDKPVQKFEGVTLGEAVHLPAFWVVGLVSTVIIMMTSIFTQTLSPHLSDNGYTETFAAAVASVSMAALAFGKVLLGRMFDKFGTRITMTIAYCCVFCGIIGMVFCRSWLSIAGIILGTGLGCSFGAVCLPIVIQKIFGMKDYNSIYGKLNAAVSLGGAFAPMISGWVYDTQGTYTPVYVVAAVLIVIGATLMWNVLPKQDPA